MYQESHEQGIGYSLMICIHIHNDMPIMSLISMRNGFNAENACRSLHRRT